MLEQILRADEPTRRLTLALDLDVRIDAEVRGGLLTEGVVK
jgi:hypothetical protein